MQCDCSVSSLDWEGPSVLSVKIVTARKQHVCCECLGTISEGERYERVKGCWEGSWSSFATCMTCVRIRSDYCPNGFLYGELAEAIWRCLGVDL